MKKTLRQWMIGLCGVFASFGLIAGVFASSPAVEVSANSEPSTVTMLAGASARKTPGEPGIKFTAQINNYNRAEYTYGMLILPEQAWDKFGWDNNTDFIAELDSMGVNYAHEANCTPYVMDNGEWRISYSLKNLYVENYALSFVGVAYAQDKDTGVRDYAEIDLITNARSIAYVAQLALKYETMLTQEQKSTLNTYANAGVVVEKDDYVNDSGELSPDGSASVKSNNYAAKFIIDYIEDGGVYPDNPQNSFITKKAYAGGTTISVDTYIPMDSEVGGWWSMCWTTNASTVDIYAHSNGSGTTLPTVKGVWRTTTVTLPTGGPYYIYFAGAKGEWGKKQGNEGGGYAYIDNVKIGNVTETFSENLSDGIFTVNMDKAVYAYAYEKGGVSFGESGVMVGEYSAKLIIDKFDSSTNAVATYVTKESYPVGTVVTFKYLLPSDVTSSWFALCCVSDPNATDIYSNWAWQGQLEKGGWKTHSVTLTQAGYLHFAGAVGDWGAKDSPKTEGYVLIDDFTVTLPSGTEIVDDFNAGVENKLFKCNNGEAVTEGEGYVPVVDTTDYMLSFEASAIAGNEYIAMITDSSYSNVSEITFKGQWTGNAESSRWGLSYTTNPAAFSYGEEVSAINCYSPKLGNLKQDVGVVYTYKLTFTETKYGLSYSTDGETFNSLASGNYTPGANYFYFAICPAVKGNGSAINIDDFSITYADGTIVDTFANGVSTIFVNSSSKNGNYGSTGMSIAVSTLVEQEGSETPDQGEKLGDLAMKYIFNASGEDVSQVTKKAYAGGSTVSFKYYIPAGTPTSWWGLAFKDTNTGLRIYDAASTDTACYFNPSTTVTGEWKTVTYTLPAGGPYYLYFGSEVSATNWKLNGENSYMLIDNFTVNDVVETFDYGLANSAFNVLVSKAVTEGEGWTPVYGAYGAKIYFDKISSTKTTPTFITKQKISGGVTVSFDYYMSGNTKNKWWILGWTNDRKTASIYAHVEANQANNYGKDLPTNVQDVWATASVEIPAGEWYLYFGGAKGEWSGGYVIVDNIKVNGEVIEDFNLGLNDWIFDISPYSSHHAAIECVEGMDDFIPGEYSAKLDFTNSFDNNGSTFITKEAIASGGSIISFKYMIPQETTVGDWWSICWDTNGSSPNFWAVGNGLAEGSGGANPNPNKYKGQGWVEYSVTIPGDASKMYYVYFCGYQNWSGCVYIDDFQIISTTGIHYDDFTNGADGGLFNVNNAKYVTYADGCIAEELEAKDQSLKIEVDKLTGAALGEFITKQAYPAGSVVSFKYYIPSNVTFKTAGTWWTLCVTSNPLKGADVYSNHFASLPKQQGDWYEVSYTLDRAGYIYFAGAIGEWNGGCVYIDDFTVKANGETYKDTFSTGADTGLFMVNTANAISVEKVVIMKSDDPYALINLLANNTVLEVLANGGYASLKYKGTVAINPNGMPDSLAVVEGRIIYTLSGEKEFAIYFGSDYYFFITNGKVAVYNNTQLVKAFDFVEAADGVYDLRFVITANGKTIVKVNGSEYASLGYGEWFLDEGSEIKIVALGGDGMIMFTEMDIDTYRSLNEGVAIPVYFSTESIDFTAYAFDTDNMISEEGFQLLADAGFTKTLALLQGRLASGDLHEQNIPDRAHVERLMVEVNNDAIAALLLAEKYGMKHYVLNSNLYNLERNPDNYQWVDDFAELSYEEYSKVIIDGVTKDLSETFAGFFFADEPQAGAWTKDDEINELVNAYKAFKQAYPNSEAYINLLPIESTQFNDSLIFGKTDEAKYKTYVQTYITKIACDYNGVPGTGYVSYDHYPLLDDGITEQHLRNLEIVAELCRDNNLEFRTYIKVSEKGDSSRDLRKSDSANDIRFQIYSALAYGVEEIIYYNFTDHYNTDSTTAGDGVLNGNTLKRSALYNYVAQVNNEVHAFGAAFMSFKWKSASVFGKVSITQFNKLQSKASVYGALTDVSSSASILVGNFDDADGVYDYEAKNAYMVMNYGDPDNSGSSSVTLTFSDDYNLVLYYKNGKAYVEQIDEQGQQLTLNLENGEGVFVIPYSA